MLDPKHPLAELIRRDRRFPLDAYIFVFEALNYAQNELGMGKDAVPDVGIDLDDSTVELDDSGDPQPERHVTGQELCEAIRRYSIEQFGLMARVVLRNWNIRGTSDFGEIVFNLIEINQFRKTKEDRREDFNNVYDFHTAFETEFQADLPPQF